MPRRKLPLECVKIRIRAEVLQLASDFRLLGLLTAAPHGVDPLYLVRVRISGALVDQNVSWIHHTHNGHDLPTRTRLAAVGCAYASRKQPAKRRACSAATRDAVEDESQNQCSSQSNGTDLLQCLSVSVARVLNGLRGADLGL